MYQALYRSFRPETFEGILGQEHIVRILKNQIDTGTTSHAYLFCGTRGTGKTSTARILAKGMNCLAPEGGRPCGVCENCVSIKNGTFMDVVEIDAASNNGVENIRELRESVKYPPVAGRCKVYIIDEVHMLSTGAFNALLKTLEEPPEQVMFILATTEVHKLPATILSRCLRLDFKRVPERKLKEGMAAICKELGIAVDDGALSLICANADGSVRDGLSLLDQCISGGGKSVSREDVLELIGASGEEVFLELTDYVTAGQVARALLLLNQVLADGKDVRQLIKDWIEHFRSLLMTKYIKNPEDVLNMSFENVERIRSQSQRLSLPVINNSILELSKTLADAKWSTQPRVLLELAIVRLGSGEGAMPPLQQRMAVQTTPPPVMQTAPPPVTQMAGAVEADVPPWELSPGEGELAEAIVFSGETSFAEGEIPGGMTGNRAVVQRSASVGNSAAAGNSASVGNSAAVETVASSPKPEGEIQALDVQLDELWYNIFESNSCGKGSFQLLRMGSTLVKLTDSAFFVEAGNDVMRGLLKSNELLLTQLMEQQVGRKLHMEIDTGERQTDSDDNEKKARELARAMENRLGIGIEVK